MLYQKIKSSQRSYTHDRTQTHLHETGTKRYGNNTKYGRNSVVILSTAGWRESQEALQDSDSSGTKQSTSLNGAKGVVKTEEVRVHHERISTYGDESSIELKSLGQVHHQSTGRPANSPDYSF
jgi:hypothetical protein